MNSNTKNDKRVIFEAERRIALLGDNGVGKTSLLYALNGYNISEKEVLTTDINYFNDDELGSKFIDLPGGYTPDRIKREINRKGITDAIVVIDAQKDNYISKIDYWNKEISKLKNSDSVSKFLVFSKIDLNPHFSYNTDISSEFNFEKVYKISVKNRQGIQELRSSIKKALTNEEEKIEKNEVATIVHIMIDSLCELVANNPNALWSLEWRDMERLIATALEEIGFSIKLTPSAKDGGKDVVASCFVENKEHVYYIEIKHWKKGSHVGEKSIDDFIEINLHDKTNGGLFISTSGFTSPVYSSLSRFMKQKVRLGNEDKIVSLCQHYSRKKKGIWYATTPLPDLLFSDTLKSDLN